MAGASEDCAVGYCRPPKEHQFRKGQSGNSKGRPKKSKNLQNLMDRELDQVVVVKEGGRELRLTKREAIVKRHVNSAMTGNTRAIEHLLRYCSDNGLTDPFELTAEDEQVLLAAVRREARKHNREAGDGAPG